MLSLPNLAPQDSYTLWYTSSSSTISSHSHDPNSSDHLGASPHGQNAQSNPQRRQQALHRHPLARLRLDEEYIERRKQNIQNYGNSWIKPPGIPKSLYQLREEKREMEEHQEALRREQLAQELAEAEAEAEAEATNALLRAEAAEGEDEEEVRDLDDDIPEADATAMTYDDPDESEEEEDEDDDEEESQMIEEVPRGVLAARLPDDVYREALVRGEEPRASRFGDEGDSTVDGEDPSQMLQEEDLVHEVVPMHGDEDMDMDADLDAEIPDADEGGYEHTDTEAELSSSSSSSEDEESLDENPLPPNGQTQSSMVRSDGTQNSMDLSGMLSNNSSHFGSSPQQISTRRLRRGP
ncbi:hypothetical protein HYALB_00010580 [Hymenoscyphus albidus]|uniref:Apc15p protein-domain-containing protein n=1 Tax=Hymenoscyphus albidus TaxID=595503 RepID=A0A9N9Q1B6_9HELO|nr:hypothetical protein HYALB_00010580 [Hymenoscyphus albidus]